MTRIIAFDGVSGTGKSSVSYAVAERLEQTMKVAWIPHQADFGINHLRDLMFKRRIEFGIDEVSERNLAMVMLRQQWLHYIQPRMGVVDLIIMDNPCLPIKPTPHSYTGEDFAFELDLHIIMLCDISLVPNRVASRPGGAYKVNAEDYAVGGRASQTMEHFRRLAEQADGVLGLDTTNNLVSESANLVIDECSRRFDWNAEFK